MTKKETIQTIKNMGRDIKNDKIVLKSQQKVIRKIFKALGREENEGYGFLGFSPMGKEKL